MKATRNILALGCAGASSLCIVFEVYYMWLTLNGPSGVVFMRLLVAGVIFALSFATLLVVRFQRQTDTIIALCAAMLLTAAQIWLVASILF